VRGASWAFRRRLTCSSFDRFFILANRLSASTFCLTTLAEWSTSARL
jgi:hypothetical protein